ncbi:hypothetical protein [Lentzea albidocapillata]|uniref:IrrE N-terminal-like domain-containing protein n=1 Tax=Lentzea albidocapillata TaxID=40571 RepID=A0A1W2D214_9PSEU|nr:hypothetical protein [Lentzea albidocapillata]SMC91521.1 hypothetical protein SAMN05660733_02654 [Lentzea albidocapillata]
MSARRLRKLLRGLDIPVPFDVSSFAGRIAARRGRPIHLMPFAGLTGVCGLWIATDAADIIFFEEETAPFHQEHIVLHELSHVLCDHYPASASLTEMAELLLPSLDPALVRRVLGRTGYSTEEEREAELLATLIRQRVHTGTTLADRLHAAFDGFHG